jgi:hypothetical protein
MKFLLRAHPKPGSRKIKCGARQRGELKNALIKIHRLFDIRDMNGCVIQLGNLHVPKLART